MVRLDQTSRDYRDAAGAAKVSPQDYLFVLLECNRPLAGAARHAITDVDEVVIGRGDGRAVRRETRNGARRIVLTVPDRMVSSTHARILRKKQELWIEDLDSTNGVFVDGARVTRRQLERRAVVECGRTLFCVDRDLPTPYEAPQDVDIGSCDASRDFATLVPALCRDWEAVRRVARSSASLLFLAETGAGKEVAARIVHQTSARKGAFVAVNCGALTSSLAEGLLFGHVRGAFSGAHRDALGFVRESNGGTLFLDEIGDLPLSSQPALLRVLQEREVMPIGSSRSITVDLRIIAATHRSLPQLAAQGHFRPDLLARLDGFTFTLPPLRERLFDLALVLSSIVGRKEGRPSAELRMAPDAARALYQHAWPGNIREFEQCVLRALTLSDGDMILREHLAFGILSTSPAMSASRTAHGRVGSQDLCDRLRANAGNVAAVARETGKAPLQVRRWMKKLGIDPNDYRS
jgi:transcriptional regulator of acetoin/glycerol metabolism